VPVSRYCEASDKARLDVEDQGGDNHRLVSHSHCVRNVSAYDLQVMGTTGLRIGAMAGGTHDPWCLECYLNANSGPLPL
jgi:hypothetical protein